MYKSKHFLDQLIKYRFRSNAELDRLLSKYERHLRRPRPSSLKGVHNGVYFNVKVPPRKNILPDIPKLRNPTITPPKPFQSIPPPETSVTAASASAATPAEEILLKQEQYREFFERLREWWKANWSILVMNFGSFCSLAAFTRSDVLELRVLSVTGSISFLIYNFALPHISWLTIGWTTTFAAVNSWKISQIIYERHSNVQMTEDQQDKFVHFFMPHGITPKQFQLLEQSAERIQVQKNNPIIKQGDRLEHVYLVVEGSTRASVLGRYLTAASASPVNNQEAREGGGDAGAWVGEMAFLESFSDKEQGKFEEQDNGKEGDQKKKRKPTKPPISNRSIHAPYTVVAKEDCVVWRWTHANMEQLMEKSSDFRAALTRAMMSAIVGKVISFTESRGSLQPSWRSYLTGFKHKLKGGDSKPKKERADDTEFSQGNDAAPA